MIDAMPTKLAQRFTDATRSSADRIAIIRTLAPLAWTAALLWVSQWFGFDLIVEAADATSLSPSTIAAVGPVLIGGALYLVGKYNPGLFERLILIVPVLSAGYRTTDGQKQVSYSDGTPEAPITPATSQEATQWLLEAVDEQFHRPQRLAELEKALKLLTGQVDGGVVTADIEALKVGVVTADIEALKVDSRAVAAEPLPVPPEERTPTWLAGDQRSRDDEQ